jgi:branched-chain amino acid transport system permease protein
MSVAIKRAASIRSLSQNELVRRFGGCLVGMIALALMTGPSGSASSPTSGFTGSLWAPRALIFLALAVALFVLITIRRNFASRVRSLNDAVLALPRRLMPDRRVRVSSYVVLLGLAIGLPQMMSGYWQEVLVDQIGIYVLLTLGLNVVVGYAGLLDLGYIAFYAIGAYSAAYWTGALPVLPPFHLTPFFALPLAVIAAMLAGVLLGAPTLRLRGDYLAIVTLGFGEIISIVATNLTGVTGGASGVLNIPHFSFQWFGIHYLWSISSLPYYYLLLGFTVIVLVAFHSLENSRVGRAWTAIREDEVAAEASGVHVLKYKVMAFAIGASTSGFAGMLTASKISYLTPGSFTFQLSILILVLVVFGGMGSLPGAVLGAAVLQWVPQYLRVHPLFGFQPPDLYIYLGALLVTMMIFRPQGIWPSRRRAREIVFAEHGIGAADAMSPELGAGAEEGR